MLVKLNLGCGLQVQEGWLNVDYALGARLTRLPLFHIFSEKLSLFNVDWDSRIFIHDLRKRFPWGDQTVDVIYSSHTLEHFSQEEGLLFLNECHRVLRNGGLIRIVVPDLSCVVADYISGQIRADYLLERLGVAYGSGKKGIKRKLAPFIEFPHKCMYDTRALLTVLQETGFKCETKQPFSSSITDISKIEQVDRTVNAVIVEGTKL